MLDRIDIKNILFSLVIGTIIGLFAQIVLNPVPDMKSLLICVLISGIIGLIVGTIITFIMALLPIKNAKPISYFIINNLIALFITLIAILSLYFYGVENFTGTDLVIVLIIALVIIIAANILEYYKYKRTNKKLMEYIEKKNKLK
jgi:drug/metabolite transporter (DMT)-like permease